MAVEEGPADRSPDDRWAEAMLEDRGIQGVRVLQGLLSLATRYPDEALEEACQTALSYQAFRLRTLRELLKRKAPLQKEFEFTQEHPIIRPLADYQDFVASGDRQQRGFADERFEGMTPVSKASPARPRQRPPRTSIPQGPGYTLARPSVLDIPCRVAPQQSPTPFLRTLPVY